MKIRLTVVISVLVYLNVNKHRQVVITILSFAFFCLLVKILADVPPWVVLTSSQLLDGIKGHPWNGVAVDKEQAPTSPSSKGI
jgi:hypothetical protein